MGLTSSFTVTSLGELAERRLRESHYYFLRGLTCHVERGVLIVRGSVPDHRLRKVAELIVARVNDSLPIDNQVRVVDPSHWNGRASA